MDCFTLHYLTQDFTEEQSKGGGIFGLRADKGSHRSNHFIAEIKFLRHLILLTIIDFLLAIPLASPKRQSVFMGSNRNGGAREEHVDGLLCNVPEHHDLVRFYLIDLCFKEIDIIRWLINNTTGLVSVLI